MDTKIFNELMLGDPYIFRRGDDVFPELRKIIFDEGRGNDHITPFEKGLEWTYEFLSQYQPRTARQLLGGSQFTLIGKPYKNPFGEAFDSRLIQEVNGQWIEINRSSYGNNPDDPTYSNAVERSRKAQSRILGYPAPARMRPDSLPKPIRMAYYHRIDGMGVKSPSESSFGGLPAYSGSRWMPVDQLLRTKQLEKKFLPLVEEMIPGIKPDRKDMPYTNFMMFLSYQNALTTKRKRDGDRLFVKNHIQDGVIYYVRDCDFENMMILADPAEAIDRYCEHILLGREERFDFRPWTIPFESPTVPPDMKI